MRPNIKLLRYLMNHPLNRRSRFRSIQNIMRYKLATSLLPKYEFIVPFVNEAHLIITPGRWGSEAQALLGLEEFQDMGFLLSFLRPTDLFCDIGANIGTYTVLASAAIGAESISIEPIKSSYVDLKRNIDINNISDLVDARNTAIGKNTGKLTLTANSDTTNHVLLGESNGPHESVHVDTLDHVLEGKAPALLKIDVEGWEHEVLQGALKTLRQPDLVAIIVELNNSGEKYGFSDDSIHKELLRHDFSSYQYMPFERQLIDLGRKHNTRGNTLYIRNLEYVQERLINAPPFKVRDFII